MSKKNSIIIACLLLLLIGVYSFFKRKTVPDASLMPEEEVTVKKVAEVKLVESVEPSAVPVTAKTDSFSNLDEVAVKKKFIKTRNMWIADPSFSEEEKKELIAKLAEELFPNGNVPPETEADKREQERMSGLIETLKQESEAIKNNKALSVAAKEQKIKLLLDQFLIDMDR